jgi:hypothetical protein
MGFPMRRPLLAALLLSALLPLTPASANDTTAELGTGGLVFITTETLRMDSEDLFVSPDQVKVTYQFTNLTDEAQDVLVEFPLPDITGDGDFNVAIPDTEADNMFDFATTFDGKPVTATLHQQAYAFNLDQTAVLKDMGVPLTPFGERTREAIGKLNKTEIDRLLKLGLVIPMEYSSDGKTWQTDYEPVWTLRSTYSWEAHFKPNQTVEVVHSYKPSVGGKVAVTFLSPPNEYEDRASDYNKKFCTDEDFLNTVKKTLPSPEEYYSAPYTESWISYVWSTGNNWAGPIGNFTLTIDKGDAKNLVSFCWDGEVKKVGPTTFQMTAKDWYPPYGRELDILILNHHEAEDVGG